MEFDVLGDADDLHLPGAVGVADGVVAADGIGVGKIGFGEALADDGDHLRSGCILRAEVAAGDEGNVHGFEIVAADDVVFDVN